MDRTGRGVAVLLVHGFPFDRTMWRSQLRTLGRCERIAPDLRGLGQSDLGIRPVTMASYADDLARILDLCEIQTAVICGLSMGGYVAFEFMRRHRERARGLVLMDSRAEAEPPEGRLARDEMARVAEREGMRPICERLVPRLLAERTVRTRAKPLEHLRKMVLSAPVRGVAAALQAMRDRADARAWLGTIDVPTLVIVGAEDRITPIEAAANVAESIPGAGLAIVPGAGHIPPMERPELTNRLLADFVSRVS